MNIFGTIMNKIFGGVPAGAAASAVTQNPAPEQNAPPSPLNHPGTPMDARQVLSEMAQKKGQKLNWETSIVDLMKLLDMDSSITARKQLAQELHYTGDMNDSATMNIWLQKEVMKRFSENGGRVPSELLH